MSLAAYSAPANTTTGAITAAQASVVAAPAPQIAYSASLPPVSAAPAPVAYSAPAVSLAPRSTSFVPAPTISAAPVAYSAPVASVAPRSTSFVPVPAAGYTLPQTGNSCDVVLHTLLALCALSHQISIILSEAGFENHLCVVFLMGSIFQGTLKLRQ